MSISDGWLLGLTHTQGRKDRDTINVCLLILSSKFLAGYELQMENVPSLRDIAVSRSQNTDP